MHLGGPKEIASIHRSEREWQEKQIREGDVKMVHRRKKSYKVVVGTSLSSTNSQMTLR